VEAQVLRAPRRHRDLVRAAGLAVGEVDGDLHVRVGVAGVEQAGRLVALELGRRPVARRWNVALGDRPHLLANHAAHFAAPLHTSATAASSAAASAVLCVRAQSFVLSALDVASNGPCAPRSPGSGASTLSRWCVRGCPSGSASVICPLHARFARKWSRKPGITRWPMMAFVVLQPIHISRLGCFTAQTAARAMTSG